MLAEAEDGGADEEADSARRSCSVNSSFGKLEPRRAERGPRTVQTSSDSGPSSTT